MYVFGQERVCVVFELPRRASVTALRFWRDKLVCLGSKNDLVVFSLESKRVHASYSPPGTASVMHVDHCLEFVLLGLQNGKREISNFTVGRVGKTGAIICLNGKRDALLAFYIFADLLVTRRGNGIRY